MQCVVVVCAERGVENDDISLKQGCVEFHGENENSESKKQEDLAGGVVLMVVMPELAFRIRGHNIHQNRAIFTYVVLELLFLLKSSA